MHDLILNADYRIALCSGEIRHWRYLGPDARSQVWWRDLETGLEFSESSLMYAWSVVADGEQGSLDA